jgi:AcrR family transcriptional regulator
MPRNLPDEVRAATAGDPDAVRRHVLAAASRVIARDGLAAASTRAIAGEAGVAGSTLYNYFDGHAQLLAKAIVHHAVALMGPMAAIPSRAGRYTVAGNLRYFVRQAAQVLGELVPTVAAAFSDPALLAAVQREMAATDLPADPGRLLEQYLLAERELGRVRADADCRAAAAIVTSLCHDDAFSNHLRGQAGRANPRDREIELLTRAITP